jgi:hypothetical protein
MRLHAQQQQLLALQQEEQRLQLQLQQHGQAMQQQQYQVRRQRQFHSAASNLLDARFDPRFNPRVDRAMESTPYNTTGGPQGRVMAGADGMFEMPQQSGGMAAVGNNYSGHTRPGSNTSGSSRLPPYNSATLLMGGTGGMELPPSRRSTPSNVTRSGSVLTAPVTEFLGPSHQRLDQLTVGDLLAQLTAALHAQEQQQQQQQQQQ